MKDRLKRFKGKRNTNGFDKRPEDAKKGGRPASIRRQLSDLMDSDGNVVFSAKQVIDVRDDGSVMVKVPTKMQMAMKLSSWAMSGRGVDSIKAIKMIMEQLDGKPVQEVKQSYSDLSDEELDARLAEYGIK